MNNDYFIIRKQLPYGSLTVDNYWFFADIHIASDPLPVFASVQNPFPSFVRTSFMYDPYRGKGVGYINVWHIVTNERSWSVYLNK